MNERPECKIYFGFFFAYLTMADDEANGDIGGDSDEVQEKTQKKVLKHDSGAADLEKVTDYAEEKEIYSADFSGVC